MGGLDIRCPRCGEEDDLRGERARDGILLTCGACGYLGPRDAVARCERCAGTDLVSRPKAIVERARGTQLVLVGYTTVALCAACDAEELAHSLKHNSAVLPKELPTVDPATLRAMRHGHLGVRDDDAGATP